MENGPTKIKKRIIHRIIGYPTLDRPKSMRCDANEAIEKNTRVVWNKKGMSIDTIIDPIIAFSVHVMAHKFY